MTGVIVYDNFGCEGTSSVSSTGAHIPGGDTAGGER